MNEMTQHQIEARKKAARKANAGFTLVELMVVIAIIATLAAIVGVNVFRNIDEANVGTAKAQISNLKSALVSFKLKNKKLPQSLEELATAGILDGKVPSDPWGNPYVYTVDGSKFLIVSYGADGRSGGTEYDTDISSDNLEGK